MDDQQATVPLLVSLSDRLSEELPRLLLVEAMKVQFEIHFDLAAGKPAQMRAVDTLREALDALALTLELQAQSPLPSSTAFLATVDRGSSPRAPWVTQR